MLALLALTAGTLCACAPEPAPSPTPTAAFATEEEAFAAAEEVYRAYLDTAAERAVGTGSTPLEDYLTGEALEADIQTQRSLNDQGIRIIGASKVHELVLLATDVSESLATIRTEICIDISESRVVDENGTDVTPVDRPDRGKLSVEFIGNSEGLLISRSTPAEESEC